MLKIYLNGELEQSVYDVAIVNPEVKPSSVIVNASLRKAFRELKIMNRPLDYKEKQEYGSEIEEVVSNRGQRDRINDDNILFAGDIDAVCWIYRSNTQVIYAVYIGSICPIRTVYMAYRLTSG